MKQAILILAHRDLPLVERIVRCFDRDFDLYIHIDKKCKEPIPSWGDNVHYVKKYRIEWGSERIFWAIYDLLAWAASQEEYSYFHIISGSDYPIKPVSQFKSFFSQQNKNCYIEYHALPRKIWVDEGGLERLKYYWIGNQWRDIRYHGTLTKRLVKIQRKLGFSRNLTHFGKLYGGGLQFSLSNIGAAAILSVPRSTLHRHTIFSHSCEEIIPQTILLNSPWVQCINNSLHLILWDEGAASPRTLTAADFNTIKDSDAFFARKLDPIASAELLHQIDTLLLNIH